MYRLTKDSIFARRQIKLVCYTALALLRLLAHLVRAPWRDRPVGMLYLLMALSLIAKPLLSAAGHAGTTARESDLRAMQVEPALHRVGP